MTEPILKGELYDQFVQSEKALAKWCSESPPLVDHERAMRGMSRKERLEYLDTQLKRLEGVTDESIQQKA